MSISAASSCTRAATALAEMISTGRFMATPY
jgi:hypothetical protein